MSVKRGKDDQGLAIVVVALSLVVLMMFAALAIDMGAVYSHRRIDQNAADAGELGGAQDLLSDNATLVAQVKARVHGTLGETLSAAEWNSCGSVVDPDSVDTMMSGSNCITVNVGRTRIQVRIPTRQYNTSFGRVLGVNSLDHDAFAIAGLVRSGFGAILPFGLSLGAGAGDGYACVKTGPGGHSESPCSGPASGNFGFLDFGFHGSAEINTPNDCGNGIQRTRNENNTAAGVDHDLSTYGGLPHGTLEVVDTVTCGTLPRPNAAITLTGNTPANFGAGMFAGVGYSDGGPGRLQRSGSELFGGAGSETNVGGQTLDDNPLWEFIPTTFPVGANVPDSCHKSVFTEVLGGSFTSLPDAPADVRGFISAQPTTAEQLRWLLRRCISHYNGDTWVAEGGVGPVGDPPTGCSGACTGAVFSRNTSTTDVPDLYDIQYTSRFGYVPELTSAFPSGNATVRLFTFRPIFLQRLLAGNCGGGTCTHDFEPGLGYTNASSEDHAEGITAFVLPRSSLPGGLGLETAPFDVGVNRFVRLLR
jgi:hypothetical protein